VSTAILPFSGTYDIDRTHSSVHFAVTHIVSTFRASFDEVEGHADAHPELSFHSTGVELRDDGSAIVKGELTIRGISRPVIAEGRYRPPIVDPFGTVRAAIALHAIVDRRDWGLSWQLPLPNGGDAVGWDVELTAELEFVEVA
jgi:polyisoprenoid-binding protein YceI